MMFNLPVFVIISDLNYEGGEMPRQVSRQEFYRMQRWNGRYLVERCSRTKFMQAMSRQYSRQYSEAIQKKYNVGPTWENDRWLVENVRPTL